MSAASFWQNQACAHLVAHGARRRAPLGRRICAAALREARRSGREYYRRQRFALLFICGRFPVKEISQ
jgi:hypothetical protein